jgi:hypothetical protein
LPQEHGLAAGDLCSYWYRAWYLLDLPQRLDRDRQAQWSRPNDGFVRQLPQDDRVAAGDLQPQLSCAWYLRDLPQRLDRDRQADGSLRHDARVRRLPHDHSLDATQKLHPCLALL